MPSKIETRGRKALSPEQRKPPQSTVKVNEVILPFVKELKGNLKKGLVTDKTINRLFNVLNNDWKQASIEDVTENISVDLENEVQRLKSELLKLHQINAVKPLESTERLKLVEKYDSEHLKVVKLESVVRSDKSIIDSLNLKVLAFHSAEHGCQFIKANGDRCTRISKTVVNWHGVEINVCSQHSKNKINL